MALVSNLWRPCSALAAVFLMAGNADNVVSKSIGNCNLSNEWKINIDKGKLENTENIIVRAKDLYWAISRRAAEYKGYDPAVTIHYTQSDGTIGEHNLANLETKVVAAKNIYIKARTEDRNRALEAVGDYGPYRMPARADRILTWVPNGAG